jgi:glycosyltransferase involved in cell wall biosynthesis
MNNGKKTIVIITPAFPASESETYWVPSQQLLVKALKRNFQDITIIVVSYLYPYSKTVYSWNGIKVISFDGTHRRKLKRPFLLLDMWKILKKIKNENNVIGLFSFWCTEGALVGKWFGKWHKLKHFCWICGQDARKQNWFVKFIRPDSRELVAISDFIAAEFYKNHRVRPQYTIPNGIDEQTFPAADTEIRDIDVLAVGSLIPLKQFDIFISVIQVLKKEFPNIKAALCGDGGEKQNIKALINKFNLSDHISLIDAQAHVEVLKLMQRSKILLHPSAYEGFSTVCLEALYAGAHVISFTKPMKQDIKNWHIVNTKEEMIAKASELLQKPGLPHEKLIVYSINDSARSVRKLFDDKIEVG